MSSILAQCREVFGKDLPDALFYHFDNALRFELAGDADGSIPRFLKAYDRGSAILRFLFAENPPPLSLLKYFSETEAPVRKYFSKRLLADFDIAPESVVHLDGHMNPGDELYEQWVSIDPALPIERLLWSALASDLAIRPKLPGWLYLVDLERGLAVYPYDDRGMDVVAMDRETLLPLYREFGSWLLDYDRNRMDDVFGSKT